VLEVDMVGRWRARGLVAVVVALCASTAIAQSPIQYVYDDLGRLIAVIDPNGDTANYHYDAVGNLLSIDRHASSQIAIISFSPSSGPIGTTVIINGTGFSATAAQDSVTFNGVSATVSSATTTQLMVTVPATATTGAIAVISPSGSATSAASFTVTATNGAPTITSFTPSIGPPGTAVTISGTNFDTNPSADRTQFNTSFAQIMSATATSLTTSVPAMTGSGRLSVRTPLGAAVSVNDFIVPPSPYTPSDVESANRISFATATPVTVSTANKVALLLFDGTAGQRVSIVGANGVAGQLWPNCDLFVSVFNPNGTVLAPGTCMEGSGFIDTMTLATTGTYTVLVDPASTVTGSVTLTLNDIHDTVGTITPGGSPVTVTTTVPGQNGTFTFSGAAGQRVSLFGDNATGFNQTFGCDLNVSIRKPDASVLTGPVCMDGQGGPGFIDVATLPAAGTYTVLIDPLGAVTGSVRLTLYNVPADASGTITPGGSSVTTTITTPGQNGALTFSGTAGQRVSLYGSATGFNQTFGCDLNVTVQKPDASVFTGPVCMDGQGGPGYIDVSMLPATGTLHHRYRSAWRSDGRAHVDTLRRPDGRERHDHAGRFIGDGHDDDTRAEWIADVYRSRGTAHFAVRNCDRL